MAATEIEPPPADESAQLDALTEKAALGRPRKEISLDELERFLRIHPTFAEIAKFFGISERTVERRYADDPRFRALIDDGRQNAGRRTLRRAFMAAADRVSRDAGGAHGDSALVIFFAKQTESHGGLGWKDRHEHDVRAQHSWTDLVLEEAGATAPAIEGEVDDEA